MSMWEMRDANGENCFSGETTILNVAAKIINPNARPSRGKP